MSNLYDRVEGVYEEVDFNNIEQEIAEFKDLKSVGWSLLIRLYTPPQKTKGGIILSDNEIANSRYREFIGLVVGKAEGAYEDERYSKTGHWCDVGDWVLFAKHSGFQFTYKNRPVYGLNEDCIIAKVDNPAENIALIKE